MKKWRCPPSSRSWPEEWVRVARRATVIPGDAAGAALRRGGPAIKPSARPSARRRRTLEAGGVRRGDAQIESFLKPGRIAEISRAGRRGFATDA